MNNRTRWILTVSLTALVMCMYMSCKPAKSNVEATPADTHVVKPLPTPKETVVRQDPPKLWLEPSPKGSPTDVFDQYPATFIVDLPGGRQMSIPVSKALLMLEGQGDQLDFSRPWPIYLVHHQDVDGRAQLRAIFFTPLWAKREHGNGWATYYIVQKGTEAIASVLWTLIPNDRPLTTTERARMVVEVCKDSSIESFNALVCESCITISHVPMGDKAVASGLAEMHFDFNPTKKGHGLEASMAWITNWYIFAPYQNIVYAEKLPTCWQ